MKAQDAVALANKKLNLMNNITRHDILNTLTGLFGCVDMARASASQEERDQLLADIKELSRTIQRQIEFTRIYQAIGVKEPAWQNISQIIHHIADPFAGSKVSIINDISGIEVYADPLLEKVFYNLVQNALSYGERITAIRFTEQISDRGFAIICEDDGIGIPAEMKEKIFERGIGQHTGMGLFLAREILGITSIAIHENGTFGKGARFEIMITKGGYRVFTTRNG
jgi:signal transduction histidine kinase